jgi:hypothetical protein
MLKEQDSVMNAMRRMLGSVLGDLQRSKSLSKKAKTQQRWAAALWVQAF